MGFLTTKQLLDDILARIPDNSTAMRAKCLVWLNEAMRLIVDQPRDWEFLKRTTAPAAIADNKVALPATCGRVLFIQIGSEYFFTPADELTEEEAFNAAQSGGSNPAGYVVDLSDITFYPGATGNVTLTYLATFNSDYADDDTPTIFPLECGRFLKRAVVSVANEVDRDPLTAASITLDEAEMSQLKRLDNRRKATPKASPHGYLRT